MSGICKMLHHEYGNTLKMLTSLMCLWEECVLWKGREAYGSHRRLASTMGSPSDHQWPTGAERLEVKRQAKIRKGQEVVPKLMASGLVEDGQTG